MRCVWDEYEYVMPACGGYLQCPPGVPLASNVGEAIDHLLHSFLAVSGGRRQSDVLLTRDDIHRLGEPTHPVDAWTADRGRLRCVLLRQNEDSDPLFHRAFSHRERAPHSSRAAVE